MHGTVKLLPGLPLGNDRASWPDALLSNLPNIYIYAANNPSESILAKRRGYSGVWHAHYLQRASVRSCGAVFEVGKFEGFDIRISNDGIKCKAGNAGDDLCPVQSFRSDQ